MTHCTNQPDKNGSPCDEPYTINIRGTKLRVDPYDTPFWDKITQDIWEPHTFDILSKMLGPNSVYCDLGAWIGPTVLYAAQKCRHVVCVEPDPVAYQRLDNNLRLNNVKNVTPFQFALSHETGRQRLGSFKRKLGSSMSSFLAQDRSLPGAEVDTVTWDAFSALCEVDSFSFIKIDIEGAEFKLMPTMKAYLARQKPSVYLSLHPHRLPTDSKEDAVRTIFSAMDMYRHCLTPDLRQVNTQDLSFNTKNAYRGTFLFTDG